MKKKIIVFDFDGTIWNTMPLIVEYVRKYFNDNSLDVSKLYEHNFDIIYKLESLKGNTISGSEFELTHNNFFAQKKLTKAFSGIRELLEDLQKQNILLAIVTLSLDVGILPLLKENNFQKYFFRIVTVQESISKVLSFTKILEENKLLPAEILFVTDTLGDVREANVLGIETIAVTYGTHQENIFLREKNENLIAMVHSVEDLKRKLMEFV